MPEWLEGAGVVTLLIALIEALRIIVPKVMQTRTKRKAIETEAGRKAADRKAVSKRLQEKGEDEFRKDLIEMFWHLYDKIETVEAELHDERKKYFELVARKQRLQREKDKLELRNERLGSRNKVLLTKIKYLEQKIEKLEKRIVALEEERDNLLRQQKEKLR